ncbi:MAG: YjhG/YagF family D-xylonate dehydratase [Chthonomonadales bacterium]|nr:YjhG/YagF family D-xylonate dehydratase [Chthonomonadales bacterium]
MSAPHADASLYDVRTTAPGPAGVLPITPEMLLERPSGDLFGLSQDAGMGWPARDLGRREFLVLSTQGGLRAPDGAPIALGYHTGHWEVGLLVEAAAREIAARGGLPFAACCSDPCDGRSQGTPAMMDSLAYRNDAAIVLRRLIRSLPNRSGVLGVATCDKGLPAMLMAVAGSSDLAGAIVPGGVALPPERGEDAGKAQTLGARFAHGLVTLREAAEAGCRACATPGGGCQFFGTAATAQVVAEALGLTVTHAALAPSGQPIWLDAARRTAAALMALADRGVRVRDILTEAAIRNAMVVHAACGGSTNLLLHLPAIAHAAGVRRPTVDDWVAVNRAVPRLVDVLPNGPADHPTVRFFLAGGAPEVMLHLRRMGLLEAGCLTVSGRTLGEELDDWERSERRARLRERLRAADGVDPDEVVMPLERARAAGLAPTLVFPRGNLAPEGSVVKATAIEPALYGPDGVYRHRGPARVFTTERAAVAAIKEPGGLGPGDVLALVGRGPLGAGMEEIYQVTSALKHLPWGRSVAVVTDARFSGVSTGACIGHVGPEALAGGPIGRLLEGDMVEIAIDAVRLAGSIDLVGHGADHFGARHGARVLAGRPPRGDLARDPAMPADTALWAALQACDGGTWGGCVYDAEAIARRLRAPDRA